MLGKTVTVIDGRIDINSFGEAVVLVGTGAAGLACARIMMNFGIKHIIGYDRFGAIYRGRTEGMSPELDWFAERTNLEVVREICRIVDRLRPGLPHAPCESLVSFVADVIAHALDPRLGDVR